MKTIHSVVSGTEQEALAERRLQKRLGRIVTSMPYKRKDGWWVFKMKTKREYL